LTPSTYHPWSLWPQVLWLRFVSILLGCALIVIAYVTAARTFPADRFVAFALAGFIVCSATHLHKRSHQQ